MARTCDRKNENYAPPKGETGHDEFVGWVLSSACKRFGLDSASYFEYDPRSSVLSAAMKAASGLVFAHEEALFVGEESPLWPAAAGSAPAEVRTRSARHLYLPVELESPAAPSAGAPSRRAAVRLERALSKKRFGDKEKAEAARFVGELMRGYYRAEFAELTRRYSRNLSAVTELTEVFGTSIRVRDSFRHILGGIQRYFGFDRVRLYLIDEKTQKLKGELSSDIRGQIKSISYEEIPLEPGAHRFADIVLGRNTGAFMDRYKDCVLYMPLVVQGTTIGLLIVDNLLSQQRIEPAELGMLKSFAGQIALAVDNVRLFDKVEELSQYDELTKLPLRRYFVQRFQEEFYRAERFKQPLALIWGDIDYFKEVNDTYGHQIGDKVLREISRVILSNLRKIDFPCRYGGDEVLILLPQATAFEATKLAQRLAEEFAEVRIPVPFSKNKELTVSLSLGIATFPQDASSMEELLQKADDALYWVKSHGRGKIALYGETVAKPGAEAAPAATGGENAPA